MFQYCFLFFFFKVPLSASKCVEIKHQQGNGILHRGQQMHGALPILSGERQNIIVWMRSSEIRNMCCPMCGKRPSVVKVVGKGDGFAVPCVSLCSTS